jgi:hypothetical protein
VRNGDTVHPYPCVSKALTMLIGDAVSHRNPSPQEMVSSLDGMAQSS